MKTNFVIYLIGLYLITLCGCSGKSQSHIYSEWSLQSRATNQYLYEDNGTLKMGNKPLNDSYLWIMEAAHSQEVRIKNKQSGHYLQALAGALLCQSAGEADKPALLWDYKGFGIRQMLNCGWYTLTNAASGEDKYLAVSGDELGLHAKNRNRDFETHWTLVREKGSRLPFAIFEDSVQDASFLGLRTSNALSAHEIVSDYHGEGNRWSLKKDISVLPVFIAPNSRMVAALYNMALEEMLLDIRTDSTFMAGALWPDTWTRDAVYSIYFSYAWILPEISRKTLDKQTLQNPREALQDTGSGGSWPISTDRVVWAMAGWEYFLTTGNSEWLAQAYDGLSNTAHKDIHVAFDTNVNLFKGETCSMDWRTHTYPNWFTNANIGESYSCGTNALHLFLYDFLGKAGKILNKSPEELNLWDTYHKRLKKGINTHFWDETRGVYTCYLYPGFMDYRSTQRVGVMSNGLCAILGAASAEQIGQMVENFPQYPYGAAVLYPTIPDDFAYHNKSIWPVWETPYMYAAKSIGNMPAMEHIMKSLIRQSAMFLTHKENMTYDTGYDKNTALNSDRQLWSVSAYISMVYRVLFGLNLSEDGLSFSPAVPEWIAGPLSLEGFHYRDAVIDVHVNGAGNKIKSLKLNGEEQSLPFTLSPDKTGKFVVDIELTVDGARQAKMNLVEAGPGRCWSPLEPVISMEGNTILWEAVPEVTYYMYGNGKTKPVTSPYDLSQEQPGYYAVFAVDAKGFESDLSNPVVHSPSVCIYEAEEASFKGRYAQDTTGFSGKGYIIDRLSQPVGLSFTVIIPETGDYSLILKGSNGYGPDGVYCAVRSVFVDGKDMGTFILEASGNWKKWMESNHLFLKSLPAGKHTVTLALNPESKGFDSNMSHGKANINDCYIDYLKVVRLR